MEAINWHSFFFLLFALVTCFFAVAVVVASSVVRMAFYLILSLGATSGLFFLAGADFVAAMQLMIYVGGTLVLLIFGVMLTAQGPFVSMKSRAGDWVLAAVVGLSLLAVLWQAAFSIQDWRADPQLEYPRALLGRDAEGLPLVVVEAKEAGASLAGVDVKIQPHAKPAEDSPAAGGQGSATDSQPTKAPQTVVEYNVEQASLVIRSAEKALTAQAVVDAISQADRPVQDAFSAFVPAEADPAAQVAVGTVATLRLVGPGAQRSATPLGLAMLGPRVDRLSQEDATLSQGMSGYLLPFEIVSVHLLVVLIGAADLARTKKRASAAQGS